MTRERKHDLAIAAAILIASIVLIAIARIVVVDALVAAL